MARWPRNPTASPDTQLPARGTGQRQARRAGRPRRDPRGCLFLRPTPQGPQSSHPGPRSWSQKERPLKLSSKRASHLCTPAPATQPACLSTCMRFPKHAAASHLPTSLVSSAGDDVPSVAHVSKPSQRSLIRGSPPDAHPVQNPAPSPRSWLPTSGCRRLSATSAAMAARARTRRVPLPLALTRLQGQPFRVGTRCLGQELGLCSPRRSPTLRGVFAWVNPGPHRYLVRSPAGGKADVGKRGCDLFLLRKLHSFIHSFNTYALSIFSEGFIYF